MIFSRRSRAAGRHARSEQGPDASQRWIPQRETQAVKTEGPFDFEEAPQAERIDLGSVLVPAMEGVEIRLQAGEDGAIQQLILVHGANMLQIDAFAAPRTDGLWDEVRPDIVRSLSADGLRAQEVGGRWGTELFAPLRTNEGFNDLRFIGIDGPRWMVRAVFRGPAAADPQLGGPLNDCLSGLVVHRDDQARPVGDALPLRLPEGTLADPEDEQAQTRKPSPHPQRD